MPKSSSVIRLIALVALALVASSATVPSTTAAPAKRQLSNGCSVSARGIPSCGAYAGGAYGANSPVRPWEKAMGRKIGIHRTYFGPTQVASAVKMARTDARHKRVPWLSFKAPYSWGAMASGSGDRWARDLATRLAAVPGPVWVAVHHEPENDGGDIGDWTRMQERLAPIMRAAAPNLAYTVILMGYHQFWGDDRYSLANIWPDTKIDVAGFDIYEKYGVEGEREWKNFRGKYYRLIQRWAQSEGVAWGLAETGYSDPAAALRPKWPIRKFRLMKKFGGVAFSYFNTNLHSKADWRLHSAVKHRNFTTVVKRGVRLR